MTTTHRLMTCCIAAAMLAGVGCDTASPSEPDIELREGETVQFKTANTDASFKWRGCEPPWGPDPYRAEKPTAEWAAHVDKRMQQDLAAYSVGAWLDNGGAASCDEGCASLDRAWTGEAQAVEPRSEVRGARAIGVCPDKTFAWSVEVGVSTEIACTCG